MFFGVIIHICVNVFNSIANMSKHHRIGIWLSNIKFLQSAFSWDMSSSCRPSGAWFVWFNWFEKATVDQIIAVLADWWSTFHGVSWCGATSWPVAWLVGGSGLHLHLMSSKKQQSFAIWMSKNYQSILTYDLKDPDPNCVHSITIVISL